MTLHKLPEQALIDLGIDLPTAIAPPGSFVGAMRHESVVTVSGQVPLKGGQIAYSGQVGSGVSIADAKEAARICLINALSQLAHATGGYVASGPDFTQHGLIIDAASQLLYQIFGDAGAHARIAIGVSSLPRGVPVEIELSALSKG